LPDATLGISHGSNNVAAALMIYGVPQVCLPLHIEQQMAGRALAEGGLGAMMGAPQIVRHLGEVLVRLRADKKIRVRTDAMRHKYKTWSLQETAHGVARDILALAGEDLSALMPAGGQK
jgi:UDP:flavonoid glycosyltransferase YjiC (YdhE family)